MPRSTVSRLLLASAALLLVAAATIHGATFPSAKPVMEASGLPPFFVGSFKALWLIDSANLASLALVLAFIAIRPSTASRALIALLAVAPLACAAILYLFLGAFYPAYMLFAAALAIVAGALLQPPRSWQG